MTYRGTEKCSEPNCDRIQFARKICRWHYARLPEQIEYKTNYNKTHIEENSRRRKVYYHTNLKNDPDYKAARKAYLHNYYIENEKELKEYWQQYRISNPDYKLSRYKYKAEHPEYTRQYFDDWCAKNGDKLKKNSRKTLMKKYGLTNEQYDQMVVDQNGICAICNGPPCGPGSKVLVVDHNHETKQTRKLLCNKCNLMLGYCKEDIKILQRAIEYLQSYAQNSKIS